MRHQRLPQPGHTPCQRERDRVLQHQVQGQSRVRLAKRQRLQHRVQGGDRQLHRRHLQHPRKLHVHHERLRLLHLLQDDRLRQRPRRLRRRAAGQPQHRVGAASRHDRLGGARGRLHAGVDLQQPLVPAAAGVPGADRCGRRLQHAPAPGAHHHRLHPAHDPGLCPVPVLLQVRRPRPPRSNEGRDGEVRTDAARPRPRPEHQPHAEGIDGVDALAVPVARSLRQRVVRGAVPLRQQLQERRDHVDAARRRLHGAGAGLAACATERAGCAAHRRPGARLRRGRVRGLGSNRAARQPARRLPAFDERADGDAAGDPSVGAEAGDVRADEQAPLCRVNTLLFERFPLFFVLVPSTLGLGSVRVVSPHLHSFIHPFKHLLWL
eukprot:Rhum_TRINITY_DN21881_c0_g1::Rhum_TRINITY_DN21881_c0_g1_i1::g.174873::m.174873